MKGFGGDCMITFSGIDCSGKSIQIENVKRILDDRGYKCKVIWSRGGYTPGIEFVKNIIRTDKNGTKADHEAYRASVHKSSKKRKLLLWFSIIDLIAYYGIYFRLIEFMGSTIIADRYIWDTYIDFKLKYDEFKFEGWFVWRLVEKIHLKPKHSIMYIIPAEESMRRSNLKFEPFPETIEQRKVRIEQYLGEIEKGRWSDVIDSQESIEKVLKKTMEIISNEN